jgi:hypothetical protein
MDTTHWGDYDIPVTLFYARGPTGDCGTCGDVDCSGSVDIDDIVYFVNYIFSGGPSPCDDWPCGPGVPYLEVEIM